MGESEMRQESSPFRSELVRGEPYVIGGRTLLPEARVLTYSRARATIGKNGLGGWTFALVQVTPVALVIRAPEGEQRLPLVDGSSRAVMGMLGRAAAIMVVFTLLRLWARRRGSR